MEKEENQNTTAKDHQEPEKETAKPEENLDSKINQDTDQEAKEEIKEPTPEEKITELEEKEEAFEYGGYNFAKEALNLIDNLERSKQILETDEKLKGTDALNKSLEHLDIIKKDAISIFERNNIKAIDSLNKKLDPNFHQAMMEIEDDTKDPGTIVQEIQKGFTIKDRLLRPSLVGVSKKTSKKEEKTEENKQNIEDK